MLLPPEDADTVCELVERMLCFGNRSLQVVPGADSLEAVKRLPLARKQALRDALWRHRSLVEAYAEQNPDGLDDATRLLAASWKHAVAGTFHIHKLLKRQMVFLGEDGSAYGVLGLSSDPRDLLDGRRLPVMVSTVLLPYKGKIVYDGLIGIYNVHFGPGIRSNLNEAYRVARRRGRFLTTLEPAAQGPKPRKKAPRDWRPVLDELARTTKAMRGGPPTVSASYSLLRACVKTARTVAEEPEDYETHRKTLRSVKRALTRLEKELDYLQWG